MCSQRARNVHVKTGEMVALLCKDDKGTNPTWIHHVDQAMDLSRLSPAEQRQMAVLVSGTSLVILNATLSHQGNYSCSVR